MSFFKGKTKPCFAEGCQEQISTEKLMCYRHWCMVPNSIRQAVYISLDNWRCGESPKGYLDAIKRARGAVAQKEADPSFNSIGKARR